MDSIRHPLARLLVLLLFVVATAAPSHAADSGDALPGAAAVPTRPATPPRELTATDLEAWLDGLMPTALKTGQAPGAVVSFVKGGQVLLEKGYGYADVATQTPVDPKTTLFRPGSTSKLFTWTAVMQQVELGRIDLDVDVNRYLDFKIPDRAGGPITMRQIMKHTAGFEEFAKDLIRFDGKTPSLESNLKNYVPPRIYDAGTTPGYSNYATALAGYIVQRVSGEPFDDYVDEHLFKPLGMTSSSFRQPLPDALDRRMATGYMTTDKPGRGFEIVSVAPAGSLSSTADDMTHFMIAHLHRGEYQGARILKPETADLMHTAVTKPFPALNGIALGFYQSDINGHRVIAHGGDTIYFHSDLFLFPDDDIGIFFSVNAPGKEAMGGQIRDKLFQAFADRYLPAGPKPTTRVDEATAKAHAALMAGQWTSTRRADSTFVSLLGLLGPIAVIANPDGTLSTRFGVPRRFVEVQPFLWDEVDGHDRIQAEVREGKVWRWGLDSIAFAFVFERPAGFAGSGAVMPIGIAALIVLLVTALMWPSMALARRYHGGTRALSTDRVVPHRLVRAAAWLSLVALALWTQVFTQIEAFAEHLGVWLRIAQITALVAFGGGFVAALYYLVVTWRAGDAGRLAKLWSVLMATAFAVALWLGLAFHLIGFSGDF